MTTARRLEAAPDIPEHQHHVAAQVVMRGTQGYRVRAVAPEAGVQGKGHIAIRIGRVLIYLQDRDALRSLRDAVEEADNFADRVYGPVLPPHSYRPRS